MNNIAVFGGAFNPPTIGHILIIEEVFYNTEIDEIIIVPDGLRDDKDYGIGNTSRIELINIFITLLKDRGFSVTLDDYFLKGKGLGVTTTYKVENYFIKKLGFKPFHIFGTDISAGIDSWSGNPDRYIQKHLKKIFVPRDGYEFYPEGLENFTLINTYRTSDVSSTKVRNKLKEKNNITNLVNKKIEDYINSNDLYK